MQEFEKRLQQNEEQIRELTKKVSELEQQIVLLQRKDSSVVMQKPAEPEYRPETKNVPVLPQTPWTRPSKAESREEKKKDFEKTVGRSLMGIFASVLIFISLILFATLLLPYFNDAAKMITTFVLSFAFTFFGLWKLQKDKENKFYSAVAGCGIGAVYISLLLSNFYFNMVGDIALYVLIALWAIAVCFLAKLKNRMFQIIGQLGITIALIFGCMLCAAEDDMAKFTALMVFYLVSAGMFYFVHREEKYQNNRLHLIFNVVNQMALFLACIDILEKEISLAGLLLFLMIAAHMASMLLCDTKQARADFGILFGAYSGLLYGVLCLMLGENDAVTAISVYVVFAVLSGLLEWRMKEKNPGKEMAQGILIFLMAVGLHQEETLYCHGILPLVSLPLLLAGFLRNNDVFRYGSMMVLFVCGLLFNDVPDTECFFVAGAVLAVAYFLIYRYKNQYTLTFKCVTHAVSCLLILCYFRDVIELCGGNAGTQTALTYAALVLFNLGMVKSVFGTNLQTGEKERNTLYNIINFLAMIAGTFLIAIRYDEIPHLIFILATLAAFTLNAKNLLDKRQNLLAGIYVGIKFTVLMITILASFHTVNYLISITCFVLAIISIVIGFKAEYRSLRVFGLALSIFSTFKLIMLDISYENTLGNALSFFASGLLCFAISMIYNFIAKKREEKEEE